MQKIENYKDILLEYVKYIYTKNINVTGGVMYEFDLLYYYTVKEEDKFFKLKIFDKDNNKLSIGIYFTYGELDDYIKTIRRSNNLIFFWMQQAIIHNGKDYTSVLLNYMRYKRYNYKNFPNFLNLIELFNKTSYFTVSALDNKHLVFKMNLFDKDNNNLNKLTIANMLFKFNKVDEYIITSRNEKINLICRSQ